MVRQEVVQQLGLRAAQDGIELWLSGIAWELTLQEAGGVTKIGDLIGPQVDSTSGVTGLRGNRILAQMQLCKTMQLEFQ